MYLTYITRRSSNKYSEIKIFHQAVVVLQMYPWSYTSLKPCFLPSVRLRVIFQALKKRRIWQDIKSWNKGNHVYIKILLGLRYWGYVTIIYPNECSLQLIVLEIPIGFEGAIQILILLQVLDGFGALGNQPKNMMSTKKVSHYCWWKKTSMHHLGCIRDCK